MFAVYIQWIWRRIIWNIFIVFCKQISQESAGYDQPTGIEEGEEEEFEHEMQAHKFWAILIRDEDGKRDY